MPIYEYRCTACGHLTELIQKMSDRALRKCPKCSGRVEKLISRAAFHLKGGGWYDEGYSKDSAKKDSAKKAETETKAKPKKEKKEKKESKSEKASTAVAV